VRAIVSEAHGVVNALELTLTDGSILEDAVIVIMARMPALSERERPDTGQQGRPPISHVMRLAVFGLPPWMIILPGSTGAANVKRREGWLTSATTVGPFLARLGLGRQPALPQGRPQEREGCAGA
jgi:hypothetical protein